MNILAEVKSFSLRIGDSISSLNKTQTCILILTTSIKKVWKHTWTQDCCPWRTFPSIFPLKAIQVQKFVSKFVRPFGCIPWLSSQAFDEKRENWWQVLSLRSFAKEILAISSAWLSCLQGYLEAIHWWQTRLWNGVRSLLWQICHQSCQQRRNSRSFTTRVLEDSVVPFWLYFGVLGLIHGKLQIFSRCSHR